MEQETLDLTELIADDDVPVVAGGEVIVTTRNSVWYLRESSYLRTERPDNTEYRSHEDVDGGLRDGVWIEFETACWVYDQWEDAMRFRVVPAGRWEGARGIVSGFIESVVVHKPEEA